MVVLTVPSSGIAENDGLPNQFIDLLRQCGATRRSHSGRTLFDHLLGTYELLRRWGNPSTVCLGGLFHSIYGTNRFRHESLSEKERPRLRSLIGNEAEKLAWDFCHVDRPTAIIAAIRRSGDKSFSGTAPVFSGSDDPDWIALAEIEVANLLEQRSSSNALRELFFLSMEKLNILSAGAQSSLKQTLSAQLRNNKKPINPMSLVNPHLGGGDE